jgi:hypothetical protein
LESCVQRSSAEQACVARTEGESRTGQCARHEDVVAVRGDAGIHREAERIVRLIGSGVRRTE